MMNLENQNMQEESKTPMIIRIPFNDSYMDYSCFQEDIFDAVEEAKKEGRTEVEIPALLSGVQTTLKVDVEALESFIIQSNSLSPIVPDEISEYLIDLTLIFRTTVEYPEVLGREREVDKAWFYLSQERRNNVFLVGEPDVGKSEIAHEICRQIADGTCPEEFANKRFLQLDLKKLYRLSEDGSDEDEEDDESLASGLIITGLPQKAYKKTVKSIRKFIRENQDDIVIFIEEGIYSVCDLSLMDLVFDNITDDFIPTIITLLPDDFNNYFVPNNFIAKYINYIEVREPALEKIRPMLQRHIDFCKEKYDIKIPENVVKTAIYTSRLYSGVSARPGNIINIIYQAYAEAARQGKKKVDKECIFACYDTDYETYEVLDKKQIENTAYHELGHTIVIMKGNLKNYYVSCVSILPMMDWAGVTMPEYDESMYCHISLDYFIDLIALDLGGRVAEEIFFDAPFNVGASSDLQSATMLAKQAVLTLALDKNSKAAVNRIYSMEDYFYMPEDKKQAVDEAIQDLLNKGYERAKEIITSNKELIHLMAKKLIKEEILTKDELENICREYNKKKG